MRRFLTPLIASFLPLLIAAPLLSAEATRTLRAELPESAAKSFAVENLAGSMVVRPGSGSKVVAIATVHAESTALAELVRFEQVEGKDGRPTLRVRYPLDEHRTIRYPGKETSDPGFLSRLFGGDSQTRTKYDGRRVTVKSDSGILLYADVEVEVPAGSAAAGFSVVAGPMSGSDLEGAFSFSTGAGGVHLETVSGEIEVDTGSGNVKVVYMDGSASTPAAGTAPSASSAARPSRGIRDRGTSPFDPARPIGSRSTPGRATSACSTPTSQSSMPIPDRETCVCRRRGTACRESTPTPEAAMFP
jgi:hypothetical protein